MALGVAVAALITFVTLAIVTFLLQPSDIVVSDLDEHTIGIISWVSDPDLDLNITGFKDGLASHGYIEDVNVTFDVEVASAVADTQRAVVKRFESQNMDLIYSLTTPGTLITKEVATQTPIVFSVVTYPVEAGIIASEQHSGNNLVGTRSWVDADTQLSHFMEIYPAATSIAFIYSEDEQNSIQQLADFQEATNHLDVTIFPIPISGVDDIRPSLTNAVSSIDTIYAPCDTLIQSAGELPVINFARDFNIPSFSCSADGTKRGHLISVGVDMYELGVTAGEKAAQILKGAAPSDLRTTAPKPTISINLETADALNVTIPQDLLLRADHLYE